jgi:hypothetical protein
MSEDYLNGEFGRWQPKWKEVPSADQAQQSLDKSSPPKAIIIHCFTCKKDVERSSLKTSHMNHEVHYTDKDGNRL